MSEVENTIRSLMINRLDNHSERLDHLMKMIENLRQLLEMDAMRLRHLEERIELFERRRGEDLERLRNEEPA